MPPGPPTPNEIQDLAALEQEPHVDLIPSVAALFSAASLQSPAGPQDGLTPLSPGPPHAVQQQDNSNQLDPAVAAFFSAASGGTAAGAGAGAVGGAAGENTQGPGLTPAVQALFSAAATSSGGPSSTSNPSNPSHTSHTSTSNDKNASHTRDAREVGAEDNGGPTSSASINAMLDGGPKAENRPGVGAMNTIYDRKTTAMLDQYLSGHFDDTVDTKLIAALLRLILSHTHATSGAHRGGKGQRGGKGGAGGALTDMEAGAVLVFLPGWHDIQAMREELEDDSVLGDTRRLLVLTLHSGVSTAKQKEVGARTPPHGRLDPVVVVIISCAPFPHTLAPTTHLSLVVAHSRTCRAAGLPSSPARSDESDSRDEHRRDFNYHRRRGLRHRQRESQGKGL